MILLPPPPERLLLPPPRIRRGARVVWSAAGRKHLAHYYQRAIPKQMVFTVQEVIEWPGSKTCVRLYELKSPTYLEHVEPV